MNRRDVGKILLIILFLVAGVLLVDRISNFHSKEETGIVKDAVKEAALTCYAVEGAYPMDVKYLRDHYGLAYDQNRYLVTYDAFATNMIPDIYVMEREG